MTTRGSGSETTSGNLSDPVYLDALAFSRQLTRSGIDGALQSQGLDAIVAPTYSFATSAPAVAGYPNISIPIGLTPEGEPAGLWMYAGFLEEPKLLALAYDLEQEVRTAGCGTLCALASAAGGPRRSCTHAGPLRHRETVPALTRAAVR